MALSGEALSLCKFLRLMPLYHVNLAIIFHSEIERRGAFATQPEKLNSRLSRRLRVTRHGYQLPLTEIKKLRAAV